MAYITASPNRIAVYDPVYGAYVRGTWDVQDGPEDVRAAEVVVSVNGAPSSRSWARAISAASSNR